MTWPSPSRPEIIRRRRLGRCLACALRSHYNCQLGCTCPTPRCADQRGRTAMTPANAIATTAPKQEVAAITDGCPRAEGRPGE